MHPSSTTASSISTGRDRLWTLAALVVIGGAIFGLYGRALDSPFIFDDAVSVQDNPSIVTLWPLVGTREFPGPLNAPLDYPTAGRPLVNFTLALNYRFGQ